MTGGPGNTRRNRCKLRRSNYWFYVNHHLLAKNEWFHDGWGMRWISQTIALTRFGLRLTQCPNLFRYCDTAEQDLIVLVRPESREVVAVLDSTWSLVWMWVSSWHSQCKSTLSALLGILSDAIQWRCPPVCIREVFDSSLIFISYLSNHDESFRFFA